MLFLTVTLIYDKGARHSLHISRYDRSFEETFQIPQGKNEQMRLIVSSDVAQSLYLMETYWRQLAFSCPKKGHVIHKCVI